MKKTGMTWLRSGLAVVLCVGMLGICFLTHTQALLSERTLSLAQAQQMALGNSSEITRQNNQIVLKRMHYVEAVEGIRAKIKDLTSFRWSPLLSFQFPAQLDLTKEYELHVKPLTLQVEIDTMVHAYQDMNFAIIHQVNQLYFETYQLQESSQFTSQRLANAQQQLSRNQAALLSGHATQTDVDRARSTVDTLTTQLSNELRSFEQAKGKLSDWIGVDVSVGYRLENGFQTAAIPREELETLMQYTLDHDQSYYEAKAATATAKLNLDAYESLMRKQYGWKMDYIQGYIDMVKQGMEVDYAAFQIQYRKMLSALDEPWNGSIRILFFQFTKEWFKGEISGSRYIEDEIYAVYTACMDYANAVRDQKALEQGLRTQVQDTYEGLVTGWNTYQGLEKLVSQSRETWEKTQALNRLGKATFVEVIDQQTTYEDAQQDALKALKDYNDRLSELDRLTCGAVTQYLRGTEMHLQTGSGGETYVELEEQEQDPYAILDPINQPYYYIYTSVADLTFYLGVSLPEGAEMDSFEVWYNGTQIGERTPVDAQLRHLTLDYQDTKRLTLRFYQGDTFVDECEIDASIPRDVLEFSQIDLQEPERQVVGTYQISTTLEGGVSISELQLFVNRVENAAFYSLHYGAQQVYSTRNIPLQEPFSYLTLLMNSLEQVTVQLYNQSGEPIQRVQFAPETMELVLESP